MKMRQPLPTQRAGQFCDVGEFGGIECIRRAKHVLWNHEGPTKLCNYHYTKAREIFRERGYVAAFETPDEISQLAKGGKIW